MVDDKEPVWRRARAGRVDRQSLRQIAVFEFLADEALDRLAPTTTWAVYGQGKRIAQFAGERSNVLVVAQGSACVLACAQDRDPITIVPLSAGDTIDGDDLPEALRNDAHLEARSDSTVVLRVPGPAFHREFFPDETARRARQQLRRQSLQLASLLWEFVTCDALTRLRYELVRLWEENPGEDIEATHAELGSRIGVHREDVTKMLGHLKAQGLIDFEPHQRGIRVPDARALALGRRLVDRS